MRWLLRFGYVGWHFEGWARQPGRRTVEGEILSGLRRQGLAPSEGEPRVSVASRTDRGVSARGNALTLDAQLEGPALLRAMNGIAPDIFFTHAAPVPYDFRVRRPIRRWYRFYELHSDAHAPRWREGARLFEGEVDVRSFGRGFPLETQVRRRIDRVMVRSIRGGLQVDLTARSFVWGMVRKIIAALRAIDRGELTADEVAAAVSGRRRLTLPLAEPEALVLWSVEFDQPWIFVSSHRTRRQESFLDGETLRWKAMERVLASLRPESLEGPRAA